MNGHATGHTKTSRGKTAKALSQMAVTPWRLNRERKVRYERRGITTATSGPWSMSPGRLTRERGMLRPRLLDLSRTLQVASWHAVPERRAPPRGRAPKRARRPPGVRTARRAGGVPERQEKNTHTLRRCGSHVRIPSGRAEQMLSGVGAPGQTHSGTGAAGRAPKLKRASTNRWRTARSSRTLALGHNTVAPQRRPHPQPQPQRRRRGGIAA